MNPSQTRRIAVPVLLAVAVIALLNVINMSVNYGHAARAADLAYANTSDGIENPNLFRFLMHAHMVLDALTAIGALVVALWLRRGSAAARIVAITMSVIGMIVIATAGVLSPDFFGFNGAPGDEVTIAAQQSAHSLPWWSVILTTGGAFVSAALLVVVVILLARPSATAVPNVGTTIDVTPTSDHV